MVKKVSISNELAEAIQDCRRMLEKEHHKWIPLSRLKDVMVIPKMPYKKKKQKNERNIFEY